jgi:hypothetical protein
MHKHVYPKHSKFIAFIISMIIHVAVILVGFFFIVATAEYRPAHDFRANPFRRPGIQLRKLQLPVDIRKPQVRKPKPRKSIVAFSGVSSGVLDVSLPEISSIKGDFYADTRESLERAGDIGFSMPEIELFGIKGKGEKVFIILDASPKMMRDEMGGIAAYSIIKKELVEILGRLPATTLFNISVYDNHQTFLLFPNMVPATDHNVSKVDGWLAPLNAVRTSMGDEDFGSKTLGPGGEEYTQDLLAGKFREPERWCRSTMLAMKQQADAVFLLTNWWGNQRYRLSSKDRDWYASSAGRRWNDYYEKGIKLLDQDNQDRKGRGEPPRALRRDDRWGVITTYFPELERPPDPGWHEFTAKDFAEAMVHVRDEYRPGGIHEESGIKRMGSNNLDFSFNVVHFRETVDVWHHQITEERFRKLVNSFNGNYRAISGLEAIQSSVSNQAE